MTGKQVLALPWGDVDVAAAAKRDTDVYTDARARSGTVLSVSQAPMTPAMSAPSGYLDDAALALADDDDHRADLRPCGGPRARRPAWRRTPAARWSSTPPPCSGGGPGPDDPLAPVAVRQRILSEAAVRMDEPGRRPLVVVFPPTWTPPGVAAARLLGVLRGARRQLDATEPRWPTRRRSPAGRCPPTASATRSWQVNHEVDDPAFTALADLTDEAQRLQGVLASRTT